MITIRSYNDWIEIYLDGDILFQGHSIKNIDMKDILNAFDEVNYFQVESNKEN